MPRYRVTIAYDGTDYVGWQLQDSGTSIQGLLEAALFPFEDRRIVVIGAGRTDAGAHAAGQVAAFTLERPVDPAAIGRALNARLPAAVRVLDVSEAPERFHPRFDSIFKTYSYRIFTGAVVSPFEYRYVWHVPGPMDAAAMRAAAAMLAGRHDFAAFQSTGTDVESTERELFESRIETGSEDPRHRSGGDVVAPVSRPATIEYIARGDGFLRHMVRAIVGSLVEVGKGRRRAEWIREVLASRDRAAAAATAPPHGLCLVSVEYHERPA